MPLGQTNMPYLIPQQLVDGTSVPSTPSIAIFGVSVPTNALRVQLAAPTSQVTITSRHTPSDIFQVVEAELKLDDTRGMTSSEALRDGAEDDDGDYRNRVDLADQELRSRDLPCPIKAMIRPSFQCLHCSFVTTIEALVLEHAEVHASERGGKCPLCTALFPTLVDVTSHIKSAHLTKSYICEHCGKGFSTKASLLQHMAVHSEVKPFRCPHCSYASARNGDLKKHLRQHPEKLLAQQADIL